MSITNYWWKLKINIDPSALVLSLKTAFLGKKHKSKPHITCMILNNMTASVNVIMTGQKNVIKYWNLPGWNITFLLLQVVCLEKYEAHNFC